MRRLIVAALILTLAACGGTSPAVLPPAIPTTRTPQPFVVIPTLSGFTCGFVEVRDSRVINPTDAQVAEDCFWQAYQHCTITGGQTFAVRDSTDETPYVDSRQGPAYFSAYSVRSFTIITGNDGACAIQKSAYGGQYGRTQAGTPGLGRGSYPAIGSICTGMTRSADGGLHVIGCGGQGQPSQTPLTTYDIPHP